MIQIDRRRIVAPLERIFRAAADVERWPEWLPHYRWVRFLERRSDGGVVEMAAFRPFGPLRYPTWWVSEMSVDRERPCIRYRHIRGITRGMDVAWEFESTSDGVGVTITHRWDGPAWPLIRKPAASLVIGPVFVHGIAQRTLAGIARQAEKGEAE
ncbi:MAG: SRPBCC family protein [Gemmatimonadetes bacterium]|nr:SRPBCC family protein [Gemmatimonadota bacterium]